jgi:hypothetical protein
MMAPSNAGGAIMSLKPTQIYLTDDERAALERAAEASGQSMTAVVRDLVERYVIAAETPPTDLTDLAGMLSTPESTDIAVDKDRLIYEDLIAHIGGHERPLRVAESQ